MAEDGETVKSGTNEETVREDEDNGTMEKLSITMDKRVDLAVAVANVLLGAFIVIAARDIRSGSLPDPITSRGLASMTGTGLVIGGIILAVRQLLTWSKLPGYLVPEEGQEDEKGYPVSAVRAFGIIVLSVLWMWLLKPLGFLIVTPLYLLVSSLVMGERSWVQIIAFSVIFTVSVWVIFGPILGIRFPLGPLTHLAFSLGLIY
jgi:putative tricarboxylic transport membrane protein